MTTEDQDAQHTPSPEHVEIQSLKAEAGHLAEQLRTAQTLLTEFRDLAANRADEIDCLENRISSQSQSIARLRGVCENVVLQRMEANNTIAELQYDLAQAQSRLQPQTPAPNAD